MYIIHIQELQEVLKMKLVRKTINFPAALVGAIQEYQQENMIATFTAAMTELIRKGLEK